MSFKDKIYEHYISYHNEHLYGLPTTEKFEKQFSANEYYLRRHLPVSVKAKILDIGCGDGNLVYWLQKSGYDEAAGVDISEEQISTGLSLKIKNLYQGDLAFFLKEKNACFDLIIARDVFEHFTKDDFLEALLLIKRSLAENGKLIIQVPNGEGLHVGSILYADATHESAYTASSLRQMAYSASFRKVTVYPVNPKSNGVKGVIRSLIWKLKVYNVKFWRYIERGDTGGPVTANILAILE
jgi:SAM-dependent methyltransferase